MTGRRGCASARPLLPAISARKNLNKSSQRKFDDFFSETRNPLRRNGFAGASFSATIDNSSQASYRLRRVFFKAHRALILLLLAFAKNHTRLACSVASALTMARCRCQLFARCRLAGAFSVIAKYCFCRTGTRRSNVRFTSPFQTAISFPCPCSGLCEISSNMKTAACRNQR